MSNKGKTLSVRLDKETTKRLDWLRKITGWPEAFIVRMLLKRAKPSDLGLDEDVLDSIKGEK